jgi:hypothetical protein
MTHNDLRYEFGPYPLNPSKRILTRDGIVNNCSSRSGAATARDEAKKSFEAAYCDYMRKSMTSWTRMERIKSKQAKTAVGHNATTRLTTSKIRRSG